MEFLEIFDLIRRRMWMLIGLCVVASVAGYVSSYLVSQTYEASALVLVRPQKPVEIVTSTASKELLDFPVNQSMSVETPGNTYIEIITSYELIGQAVTLLGLDQEDDEDTVSDGVFDVFLDYIKDELKTTVNTVIKYLKYGQNIETNNFDSTVEEIKENLSLETQPDTFVFTITYAAGDPQSASDVANTMAELFVKYMSELNTSETAYIVGRLTARLKESKNGLVTARRRLESFKMENSVYQQEVEYDKKLEVITQLEVELENLSAEIAVNQSTLSNQDLLIKRDALQRIVDGRRAALTSQAELERKLALLRLDVQVANSAYEAVANELEELEIKSKSRAPEIRMVSRAVPPSLPTQPIRVRYALLALLTAIVVGTVLAFFLEYIDQKIRSVDDVEDVLGMRVLATIPRFPHSWR